MEIYFVRHGETNGNIARRHQAENSPLTFKGEAEVLEAAHKINELSPTHLVTSSLVRAIDTAKVVGRECELVPETCTYFNEIKRPQKLYGKHHFNFSSIFYYLRWFLDFDGEHNDGGESYADLLSRINRAKVYLSKLPPDARVIVVSHSVFINFFLVHLCDDERMGLFSAIKTFFKLLKMSNTQITAVSFSPETHTGLCAWSVSI